MKEDRRIKKDLYGYKNYWWLRSVYILHNYRVAHVNTYGYLRYNYYGNDGVVVPAFII